MERKTIERNMQMAETVRKRVDHSRGKKGGELALAFWNLAFCSCQERNGYIEKRRQLLMRCYGKNPEKLEKTEEFFNEEFTEAMTVLFSADSVEELKKMFALS